MSDDDGERAATTVREPAVAQPPPPAAARARTPDEVVGDFIIAAARHDRAGMWTLLSRPTQKRLGPSLARFRAGVAQTLEHEPGAFGGSDYTVVVSERITGRFAVVGVAGERLAEGVREYAAYAVALRLEGKKWKLELRAPIRIRPLRPDPGEKLVERTQLAAEVKAPAAIEEGGIWLDGEAVPGRAGGLTPRAQTMYAESGSLDAGQHSVVAFASAGDNARAVAWTFESRSNDTA
jgi:hypothetical protein